MADQWPQRRKSTRSGSNQGACVEVADNLPGRVLVRDSKDRDGGLTVTIRQHMLTQQR
jgi:hypothetical protein